MVVGQKYSFGRLEDKRSEYSFIPYTAALKGEVAKNMVNVFDAYVHREDKMRIYGKGIDPKPKIKRVMDSASTMTDQYFHYNITDIVWSQRDFHLNYYMPAPHSCHKAYQYVRFTVIEESGLFGRKNEKVVVSQFIKFPDVTSLTQGAGSINIGDELIQVDDVRIERYIRTQKPNSGGAGESGSLRAVLNNLSFADGALSPVPARNHRVYQLKSINTHCNNSLGCAH